MKKILQIFTNCLLLIVFTSNMACATPSQDAEWLQEPNETESTAIRTGNLVFISGQASGDIANQDNTGAAVEESLQKIKTIAEKMGGDMNSIIKLDIYLVDFDRDFPLFDTLFTKYFSEHYPTRTAIGVSKLSHNHTVAINAVMLLKNK